jgi:hypothetical protein
VSISSRAVRVSFWTLAVLLGAAQAWFSRHRIFSDGISYLDIAQHYARGDWSGALNAYWSPLYSWVIAVYLVVFRPGNYWQTSALHVINFVAFLAGCWAFEGFIRELIPLRPMGIQAKTLSIAGYTAILHGGLVMVGMAPVCPDMIAFFLIGIIAWLTARIAGGAATKLSYALLGATLGVAYLDRTAFAPLSLVYLAAAGIWLVRNRLQLVVAAACMVIVGGPFAVLISLQKGSFTIGESGKLNYGWEVNGAARWTHWQGEPGDIGVPVHPTRLIANRPVPVYEFGGPVEGAYPPWYDPSYWYQGIRPHFDASRQMRVLRSNAREAAYHLGTSPIVCIVAMLMLVAGRRSLRPWPGVFWTLAIPAGAGILMYCLILPDKRYIGGFLLVFEMTVLAGFQIPAKKWTHFVEAVCLLFVAALVTRLSPQIKVAALDLMHGRESEWNVSWMMAKRFSELGIRPGDRIAYVGNGFEADWVRLLGAKIVAEVPAIHDRGPGILQLEETNEKYPETVFDLDENSRERLYEKFREAGAVIAVSRNIPRGARAEGWNRVLDPDSPGYPAGMGQTSLQAPGYYHWLKEKADPKDHLLARVAR